MDMRTPFMGQLSTGLSNLKRWGHWTSSKRWTTNIQRRIAKFQKNGVLKCTAFKDWKLAENWLVCTVLHLLSLCPAMKCFENIIGHGNGVIPVLPVTNMPATDCGKIWVTRDLGSHLNNDGCKAYRVKSSVTWRRVAWWTFNGVAG
jgi:hypothetical protein